MAEPVDNVNWVALLPDAVYPFITAELDSAELNALAASSVAMHRVASSDGRRARPQVAATIREVFADRESVRWRALLPDAGFLEWCIQEIAGSPEGREWLGKRETVFAAFRAGELSFRAVADREECRQPLVLGLLLARGDADLFNEYSELYRRYDFRCGGWPEPWFEDGEPLSYRVTAAKEAAFLLSTEHPAIFAAPPNFLIARDGTRVRTSLALDLLGQEGYDVTFADWHDYMGEDPLDWREAILAKAECCRAALVDGVWWPECMDSLEVWLPPEPEDYLQLVSDIFEHTSTHTSHVPNVRERERTRIATNIQRFLMAPRLGL